MRCLMIATLALVLGLPAVSGAGPVEDAAALRRKGKAKDAVALLEKAAQEAPADCAVKKALGGAYFDAGDGDLGAMTYEQLLRQCPKDPDAASVKQRLERHYDRRTPAKLPDPPLYLAPLPPRKTVGGRTDDDAWALEPKARFTPRALYDEGLELIRTGKYALAAEKLLQYAKKNSHDEQAWLYLGTAHAHDGNRPGAIAAYRKYLELAPDAADAEKVRACLR